MNNKDDDQKNRVLLTEDVEIARVMAEMLLKQLNCIVDSAKNGTIALELATENEYDLILMDLGLPDMSGYEVTCIIKDKNNATSKNLKTPIVALTAHMNSECKTKASQAGMVDYLLKPLNLNDLKIALKHYLFKQSKSQVTEE